MDPELASARSDVRRMTFRLYFLTLRQGARRFLDLFRFGNGTAERLAAAAVIGGLFFLVIILVAILAGTPIGAGIGIATAALLVAWGTSAVFVFGGSDEQIEAEIPRLRDDLDERRREAEIIAEELDEAEAEERAGARDRERRRKRACPYCREPIPARALKCVHCGEIVDEGLREDRERARRRPTFYPLAAFLSWLWPGLGQIYKGQVGRGLLWMLAEFCGLLCCVVPGVVIHVIGIFDAAMYNEP